jgi:hypothetical protein
MAKQAGLGDNFYYGGSDLSGDVASIDTMSGPTNLLEATGVKQSAHQRIAGERDGVWSFTSLFENAGTVATPGVPASNTPVVSTYSFPVLVTITGGTMTNVTINGVTVGTGAGTYVLPAFGTIQMTYSAAPTWAWVGIFTEHNELSPLVRVDQIAMYFRGIGALGQPVACLNAKQLNYDPTRGNDGSLTLKVDLQANGYGMEWGLGLTAGLRTDIVPTNGASIDNGASTAFGAQAYFELMEVVGTSVDIAVQHSPDNSTWTTLIDFGAQTVSGSGRGFVSNVTLVNRYLRVITSGTFTFAQFAAMVARNPIGGYGF